MALQMAEQVGYANPYRFQHLLARARWDEELVGVEIRDYVETYWLWMEMAFFRTLMQELGN